MKQWIVVANAARARVLEESDNDRAHGARYQHVADLVHPASRQKGAELADDRPGRVDGIGHGPGSARFKPRTDPREREHERFALEVARLLDQGVAEGRCGALVLVASRSFLGSLKGHLGEQAARRVRRTVAADYTALDDAALAERLDERSARD